jgi:hypothetical protein
MSAPVWLGRLLRGNPELYRQIYDWNLYPHRWARPEWLATAPGLEPGVIQALERTERGRARLSRHGRAALGLTDTFWDFEPRPRRLALLPATTLERLARFAGAVWHWQGLSRMVSQRDHRAVTDRIGTDAHAFALRRGRALLGPAGLPVRTGPVKTDSDQLTTAGWILIASFLGAEPDPVLARARLKFPRELPPGEAAPAPQAWALLQPILQETLPASDRPCFA